jgi:transposase-like protein
MGRVRTRRDAEAWREIVQRQAESGLSQAAFCAAEGLVVGSLQYWRRKFAREGRLGAPGADAQTAPWFTELAVEPVGDAGRSRSAEPPVWQIELELGGGVVLRIHRAGGC